MGGLTALVWLPDEVIAHETAATPPGLRRFEATEFTSPAPAGPGLDDPALDLAGTTGGQSAAGSRRHAMDRSPAEDEREPLGAGASIQAAPVVSAQGSGAPGTVDVIVPPAVSTGAEARLPIFESVESDWFRRTRQGADAPAGPTEVWSSPADEGWRAAEVARAPVSEGLTASGLPQRVPRANLVPGRVGPAAAVAPAAPARSAAQTQQRLASFQRAVRDARAAAAADETGTNGTASHGNGDDGAGESGTGESGTGGNGTGGAPAEDDGGQPD